VQIAARLITCERTGSIHFHQQTDYENSNTTTFSGLRTLGNSPKKQRNQESYTETIPEFSDFTCFYASNTHRAYTIKSGAQKHAKK
jgi:hypothetical protein